MRNSGETNRELPVPTAKNPTFHPARFNRFSKLLRFSFTFHYLLARKEMYQQACRVRVTGLLFEKVSSQKSEGHRERLFLLGKHGESGTYGHPGEPDSGELAAHFQ